MRNTTNVLKNVASILALASAVPASAAPAGATPPAAVTGPHGTVLIKRDDFGIPNIYADDTYSLFYGWGYAVAQDRLFQMDSTRRSSQGSAAAAFGKEYLEKDRLSLINYDPAVLAPQLAALKGEHRAALDGMVAGINARIREVLADPRLMPKEYNDFGFRPTAFTDQDVVMCWIGMLLFRFSDYQSQISNQTLLQELKAQHGEADALRIFQTLRWRNDLSAPPTVKPADQQAGRSRAADGAAPTGNRLAAIALDRGAQEQHDSTVLWGGSGPDHTPHASNTWLVNGPRLMDAQAVMVSGPQVGDEVPSMLWEASLHGAGINVTGLTYPGLLYFHYGTNEDIAWGRTALAGSIIDTYQEQLNPRNPHEYRFNGKWVPMQRHQVSIAVKDGQAETVDLYSTIHGPVILFDEKSGTAYSKRRSWAGHELDTIFAYYDEMKATNYKQWSDAIARKWNNQNQYYADKTGNIAYIQAGRYPVRPKDFEIQLPTPGTGEREWLGFQPAAQNARVLNPAQGYIANWNNRPSMDVLNTDTLLWSKLDHVDAILSQIEAKPRLTVSEIWDINRWSSHAAEQQGYFVPMIQDAIKDAPAGSPLRRIGETIVSWNGQERDTTYAGIYDSPGETAFQAWLTTALNRFYQGDIPAKYLNGCDSPLSQLNCSYAQPLGAKVLYMALDQGRNGGPLPAFDFLHGKAPADFIRDTLTSAAADLTRQYGADPQLWTTATRPKVWTTFSTMDVPWSSANEKLVYPVQEKRGSMNAIYVFRNGKVTMCDVVPPGESGFVAPDGTPDPHYRDQFQIYTSFSCKRRWVTPAEVTAHTVTEKTLTF